VSIVAAACTMLVLTYAPVEATMGPVQKIFYLHLPAAICTFVASMACFVASIGYLWTHQRHWDDLAEASARAAALLCAVVLGTGMIWGRVAWGQWWTWSPRLTFSLVLWLLYIVYLMVRLSIDSSQRRAVIAAVYGIVAFLDVPLVWLSTKLMVDIHPTSVTLAPQMKMTLALCFVPVTLAAIGLIVQRFSSSSARRAAREAAAVDSPPTSFQWVGGPS
jgi:heme exporter protein C